MKFGEKIKKIRSTFYLSQEHFAALADIPLENIIKYENSCEQPTEEDLLKFELLFDVNRNSLINENTDIVVYALSLRKEIDIDYIKGCAYSKRELCYLEELPSLWTTILFLVAIVFFLSPGISFTNLLEFFVGRDWEIVDGWWLFVPIVAVPICLYMFFLNIHSFLFPNKMAKDAYLLEKDGEVSLFVEVNKKERYIQLIKKKIKIKIFVVNRTLYRKVVRKNPEEKSVMLTSNIECDECINIDDEEYVLECSYKVNLCFCFNFDKFYLRDPVNFSLDNKNLFGPNELLVQVNDKTIGLIPDGEVKEIIRDSFLNDKYKIEAYVNYRDKANQKAGIIVGLYKKVDS